MTVFTDIWAFLRARRLWPAAVLLLVAIVAVPMVLAKSPEPAPAPPAAATKSEESALTTQPIVALASAGDRAQRRQVLGARKNPFKPQATPTPTPTAGSPAATTPQAGATTPGSGGATPGSGAGSTPSGGGSPVTGPGGTTTPGFTTPAVPGLQPTKKSYDLFELTVRFGPSEAEDIPRSDVKRLEALPSADAPVLIYLGVLDDKKTAVFLVDSGVVAQGDGTCRPSPGNCQTIHLREGETEFLDAPANVDTPEVAPAQYELDLVKIRHKATTSAKAAKKSYANVSKAGQKIVRARIAGDGPLHVAYSKSDGRLHKRSAKAFKAAVAKVAKLAKVAKAAKAALNRAEGHS